MIPAVYPAAVAALHEFMGSAVGAAGIFRRFIHVAADHIAVEALMTGAFFGNLKSPCAPPVSVGHSLDPDSVDLAAFAASAQNYICLH